MTIDLYYTPGSAPCRSVLLVAKAVDVELNLILVDLRKKEQLRRDSVKVNRETLQNKENLKLNHLHPKVNSKHSIPTLVDDELILWDSRAIITYLAQQYGKDDSLYPNNIRHRALVDQRLNFDVEKLYPCFADCYYPIIFSGNSSPDPRSVAKSEDAYKVLDLFLRNSVYVAGDNLTVADLAIVATVSTFEAMNFNLKPFVNVIRWYEKVKLTAPGYEEANIKNLESFKEKVAVLNKKLNTQ